MALGSSCPVCITRGRAKELEGGHRGSRDTHARARAPHLECHPTRVRPGLPLTTHLQPPPPPSAEADRLLQQWGRNELEEKSTPKWLIFLKMVRFLAAPPLLPLPSDRTAASAPPPTRALCQACAR